MFKRKKSVPQSLHSTDWIGAYIYTSNQSCQSRQVLFIKWQVHVLVLWIIIPLLFVKHPLLPTKTTQSYYLLCWLISLLAPSPPSVLASWQWQLLPVALCVSGHPHWAEPISHRNKSRTICYNTQVSLRKNAGAALGTCVVVVLLVSDSDAIHRCCRGSL